MVKGGSWRSACGCIDVAQSASVAEYIWSWNNVAAMKVLFELWSHSNSFFWLRCGASLQNDLVTLSILAWFQNEIGEMLDFVSNLRTN